MAFSADQVCGLTGASKRQLGYWHRVGLLKPSISLEVGEQRVRVYSFRDVVGLRTLAILRNRHRVSLQELRLVDSWLKRHHETPWAELRFFVAGKHVLFPMNGELVSARPFGQKPLRFELRPVVRDLQKRVNRLRQRPQRMIGKVSRSRAVASNEWVLRGTRIPTRVIWDFYEAGCSVATIHREYPSLTETDIKAAIEFESRRHQKVS